MKPAAPVLSVLLTIAAAPLDAQVSTQPTRRQLLDVLVFYADIPAGDQYTADVRRELIQFARRASSYRPRPRPDGLGGEMRMVYAAREGYEAKLVAAAGAAGAEALARQYVDDLRPCYEWEGFGECPEREAKFAERYLSAHPDSPFREFLPLLIAHRSLCAAEGYEQEERPQEAARSRRASEGPLAIARKSRSMLIRTAAVELMQRGRCYETSPFPR